MSVKMFGDALKDGWSPEAVSRPHRKNPEGHGARSPGARETRPTLGTHVEAAMGLAIGGFLEEARRAYGWLAETQLPDGSWYAAYRDGVPEDMTRDTNMSSYIAVGVYHNYLLTGDRTFL